MHGYSKCKQGMCVYKVYLTRCFLRACAHVCGGMGAGVGGSAGSAICRYVEREGGWGVEWASVCMRLWRRKSRV